MKNFNADKLLEYSFYLFVFLLPWQTVFLLREVFISGEKWQYGTVGIYGTDVLLILILILSTVYFFKVPNFQFSPPRRINFSPKGRPASGRQSILNGLIFHPKGDQLLAEKLENWKLFRNYKLEIRNSKYWLPIVCCLLLLWSFFSILWSPDKLIAFYFSLKLLLAVGLFSVAKSASWRIDWKKMVFVLALAGALQGALAIGQFLTQQDFDSVILGTSRHEVFAGGTSVIENESGRWLRAYGTFPHSNILGGYLSITLLIVLIYDLRFRNYEKKNQNANLKMHNDSPRQTKLKNIFLKLENWKLFRNYKLEIRNYSYFLLPASPAGKLASYFLIFSGLILSFSRAAWLAFAIGLFLIFLVEKEKRKELGKILFIFLLTLLIWASAFSPLFFSRVSGEARLEQKSINDRTEYVLQAKEIIKNNFWLGVGAGSYTKALAENNPQRPIWQIQPVHNVFLLIWSELGFVGLISFLILSTLIFLKTLKNKQGNNSPYFILFTLYFLLFPDHWLWTSHFGILFFFLVTGVIIKESEKLQPNS